MDTQTRARIACPGCSGTGVSSTLYAGVYICLGCSGYFTLIESPISRQIRINIVREEWCKCSSDPVSIGRVFYFDLDVEDTNRPPDADRPYRTHGWACRDCKGIVQTG